jgi:sulfhydrogenase subunit beta (sulfur reductase)
LEKRFLKEALLDEFLGRLRPFGELHGPAVTEQGVAVFAPLGSDCALRLDYRRTLIPPKKYLLPFRENLLQYRDGAYGESPTEAAEIVLFGLHPCDLDGIAYLDRVFLADRSDPCYARRRACLTLIGISCEPDDFCFCPGSRETGPCDLFLAGRAEHFELSVFTPKGEAIAEAAKDLLTATGPASTAPAASAVSRAIRPQDPHLRFSDDPLWERFARSCLSCGACSVCCPTCYCFDVREYPSLGGGGTRLREWDNCLFASHGEVAGANFRPTRLDRLRYRFLHKYCGFTPLEGMTSCVGCGRCKEVCPVGIDLRELIESGPEPTSELP